MKRFFAKLIPVTVALLLFGVILLGSYLELPVLTHLGIGLLFGGVFLILVVTILVKGICKYRKLDEQADDDPNDFNVYDAFSVAQYIFVGNFVGKRLSAKKQTLLAVFALIFLLCEPFGGILFLFLHLEAVGATLLGLFGVTVFVCMLTAIIKFIMQIQSSGNDEEIPNRIGRVTKCIPSPDSQQRPEEEKLYHITVEIDGKSYTAVRQFPFEVGTKVVASTMSDVALIDLPATEKLNEDKGEQNV